MTRLMPLWREWRIFILTWALREIPPLHPDVPRIVYELRYWLDQREGARA